MKHLPFREAVCASSRGRRTGVTLIEVIVAMLLLGAVMVPMLNSQKLHLQTSRSNQRIAIAESLVRDAIENLRFVKRTAGGFDQIWNNAGTWVSGISNPGGAPMNPALDGKYRMVNPDQTGDRFDRIVRLRQRWSNVPDPALSGFPDPLAGPDLQAGLEDIRFIEVLVTVICPDDPWLQPPTPGKRPFFEIVTYIADFPAS